MISYFFHNLMINYPFEIINLKLRMRKSRNLKKLMISLYISFSRIPFGCSKFYIRTTEPASKRICHMISRILIIYRRAKPTIMPNILFKLLFQLNMLNFFSYEQNYSYMIQDLDALIY